jgi:hypothetical protein
MKPENIIGKVFAIRRERYHREYHREKNSRTDSFEENFHNKNLPLLFVTSIGRF